MFIVMNMNMIKLHMLLIYKTKFAKHGIKSTKHLDDIIEEDLEELGLSGFQRRQFKKAITTVKKETMQNENNNNVVDNNEGSKNEIKKKKYEQREKTHKKEAKNMKKMETTENDAHNNDKDV